MQTDRRKAHTTVSQFGYSDTAGNSVPARRGAGVTNKAIAEQLDISARTVKFHLENVCRKLGAERRGEAIALARMQGLIT